MSSEVLARILGQVLADLGAQSSSIWMIWSSVSAILPLVLRDLGQQRPVLAFQARRLALERGQPRDLDQVLLPKLAHALQLLLDPLDLFLLGGHLLLGSP